MTEQSHQVIGLVQINQPRSRRRQGHHHRQRLVPMVDQSEWAPHRVRVLTQRRAPQHPRQPETTSGVPRRQRTRDVPGGTATSRATEPQPLSTLVQQRHPVPVLRRHQIQHAGLDHKHPTGPQHIGKHLRRDHDNEPTQCRHRLPHGQRADTRRPRLTPPTVGTHLRLRLRLNSRTHLLCTSLAPVD